MKLPILHYETRRTKELRAELERRARVWLPEWRPGGGPDAAEAILQIAARLESEVTQRLDRVPEKNFRGLLYWLGVRGEPGHAARLPIAMKMTKGAEVVLVDPPAQVQADAGGQPVIFETSKPLRVLPANLSAIIGADPDGDRFYAGPISAYEPPKATPTEWRVVSEASAGATDLQLDPPVGLTVDAVLVDAGGLPYRIKTAKDGLVTVDPGLGTPLGGGAPADPGAHPTLSLAAAFDPFGASRDQQAHRVYVGSTTGLDVTFPTTVEVLGAEALVAKTWTYWGKSSDSADPAWLPLTASLTADGVALRSENDAKGHFEIETIGGFKSRWLRAEGPAADAPLSLSDVKLVVNCDPAGTPPMADVKGMKIEGVANTAPLVLDSDFYPLGQEPRLFDAFYLGWDEAFSKPNAEIVLKLTIGGGFSGPLASISLPALAVAAGIGDDRKLHRVELALAGVAAAQPTFPAPIQPKDSQGRSVPLTPAYRPGAVQVGGVAYFSAASGGGVWLWRSPPFPGWDGWQDLGSPSPVGKEVGDTVLVPTGDGRNLFVYAVSDGKLYRRVAPAGGTWAEVSVSHLGVDATVARATPIVRAEAQAGEVDPADGLVVVDVDGSVFARTGNAGFTRRTDGVDPKVYPLAVSVVAGAARRVQVFAQAKPGKLTAFDLAAPVGATTIEAKLAGMSFGLERKTDEVAAAAFVAEDAAGARRLMLWEPFDADTLAVDEPAAGLADAPVAFAGGALVPLERGAVALGGIDAAGVQEIAGASVGFAAIVENGAPWHGASHLLVDATRLGEVFDVDDVVDLDGGRVALHLVDGRDSDVSEPIKIYRGHHDTRQGTVLAPDQLELIAGDAAAAGDLLYIAWDDHHRFVRIQSMGTNPPAMTPVATLVSALPASAPANVDYRNVDPPVVETASFRPTISAPALPVLSQADLDIAHLEIADRRQSLLYAAPTLLVLAARWQGTTTPASVVLVTAFAARAIFQPPRPTNPGLSWEYWDGTSWWQIPDLADGTANLVATGEVSFCVPPALQPTDVVGRANRWIRARLVGGDYGQEEVRLESLQPSGQKVVRDTSGIRAPYVVDLKVGYRVCCPVRPEWVLTEDNGGTRDQTAASKLGAAQVSAFTPLALDLAPPDVGPAAASATGDCGCDAAPGGDTAGAAPAAGAERDRAIYLGFDASLQGAGVSLLFLLQDMAFDGAFPLLVEGFIDGAFAPIACDDGARGLTETGILVLSLPAPLQQAVFFGQALFWLRLKPNPRLAKTTVWAPRIRGVYLNAAWVTAAETQTNELLGSSDGSPGLALTLARPPVVEGTLSLRVLEPLGDEEADALRRTDPAAVLDRLGPWTGRWVRWTQGDLGRAGPQDRVYDLDASTGVITFGDGRRGRVPPIAMNGIVAERYQAGGGAAANLVGAWSQLNLITPVQGIETTIAPEGAAGGADPQDADAVLRFGPAQKAMRGRAVTLCDFELLAFESSSKIGQTRAISVGRGVRVVEVMRGRDPLPASSELRELKRFLESRASPGLAVEVAPPRLVDAVISVRAVAPDLSLGADVVEAIGKRLAVLLDPTTGGFDGFGWRLGDMLTEADVAACLDGIPHLEDFTVKIDPAAGVRLPLKPDQLLYPAPNHVRVSCQSSETEAVG